MPTLSTVCQNLFSQTNLSKLEKQPTRGERRNLARVVYREGRRPGIVAPGEPGERPAKKLVRTASRRAKPMRHVYKFHEPKKPRPGTLGARLKLDMVPRLARQHRDLVKAVIDIETPDE